MPIYENRGNYLFVRMNEPYSLKLTLAFLREFAERCERDHLEKALIDVSTLEDPIRIWDRYQIGEEYAKVVGPKIKAAIVARRTIIDLTLENVVVNRSGRVKVFHEIGPALRWLEVDS